MKLQNELYLPVLCCVDTVDRLLLTWLCHFKCILLCALVCQFSQACALPCSCSACLKLLAAY